MNRLLETSNPLIDADAGAGVGIFLLVFVFFGLLAAGVWIWSIVDSVKINDATWDAAGQNKILWVILIVVLGLLGSILYFFIPKPALKRVSA